MYDSVLEKALQSLYIRKAIAIYVINPWIKNEWKKTQRQFANEIECKSPSTISSWFSIKQTNRAPTKSQITAIAKIMDRKIEDLIDKGIREEDPYEFRKPDKEIVEEYLEIYGEQKSSTHDNTDEHRDNLLTFSNEGYKIYFKHKKNNTESTYWFDIDRIGEPTGDWCLELEMKLVRPGKNSVHYSGRLIAPPQLSWAFIFIEQKNKRDKIINDKGVIILNFPQKALNNSGHAETYKFGTGVMISIDRNNKHRLLIQRTVIIRNNLSIPKDKELFIDNLLTKKIEGGYLIAIDDIEDLHDELSKHFFT